MNTPTSFESDLAVVARAFGVSEISTIQEHEVKDCLRDITISDDSEGALLACLGYFARHSAEPLRSGFSIYLFEYVDIRSGVYVGVLPDAELQSWELNHRRYDSFDLDRAKRC